MSDTKQVIVMRKDLNMRKGKMIAQGAHASMVFLTEQYPAPLSDEEHEWVKGSFKKVCLYVNSEAELDHVAATAAEAGLKVRPITDSGATEFHGIPTKTCIAIGPHFDLKFIGITDHLPLL